MNTFKQSAIKILKKSKIPLHYNEITKFSNCDQSKHREFCEKSMARFLIKFYNTDIGRFYM